MANNSSVQASGFITVIVLVVMVIVVIIAVVFTYDGRPINFSPTASGIRISGSSAKTCASGQILTGGICKNSRCDPLDECSVTKGQGAFCCYDSHAPTASCAKGSGVNSPNGVWCVDMRCNGGGNPANSYQPCGNTTSTEDNSTFKCCNANNFDCVIDASGSAQCLEICSKKTDPTGLGRSYKTCYGAGNSSRDSICCLSGLTCTTNSDGTPACSTVA
jgi:hypothetical protein